MDGNQPSLLPGPEAAESPPQSIPLLPSLAESSAARVAWLDISKWHPESSSWVRLIDPQSGGYRWGTYTTEDGLGKLHNGGRFQVTAKDAGSRTVGVTTEITLAQWVPPAPAQPPAPPPPTNYLERMLDDSVRREREMREAMLQERQLFLGTVQQLGGLGVGTQSGRIAEDSAAARHWQHECEQLEARRRAERQEHDEELRRLRKAIEARDEEIADLKKRHEASVSELRRRVRAAEDAAEEAQREAKAAAREQGGGTDWKAVAEEYAPMVMAMIEKLAQRTAGSGAPGTAAGVVEGAAEVLQ